MSKAQCTPHRNRLLMETQILILFVFAKLKTVYNVVFIKCRLCYGKFVTKWVNCNNFCDCFLHSLDCLWCWLPTSDVVLNTAHGLKNVFGPKTVLGLLKPLFVIDRF